MKWNSNEHMAWWHQRAARTGQDTATPPDFSVFTPARESEIHKMLSNFPNKQSDSDPIPTWLLKECPSVHASSHQHCQPLRHFRPVSSHSQGIRHGLLLTAQNSTMTDTCLFHSTSTFIHNTMGVDSVRVRSLSSSVQFMQCECSLMQWITWVNLHQLRLVMFHCCL